MLINTLFLSKPLTKTDYSGKAGNSEKLFGFLFSEIMNVNNDSEKLSLIPDHIGGNLIDYKSVFINYNFESNVLLSNPQSKNSKDPIVSLSKLFFENEILDNQKLNESEKVIYTPQQFVDSFTQLIKSILDNNNDSSKVELKLFSKNFILSQNVDNSHLQNIEKYLIKTIENEPVFSLTLSAFDKQILFEVFSQVVPSILNKETTLTQSVNLDKADENLLKISSLNSIKSIDNKNTENSSEIVNTEVKGKTINDIEARSIIANNDQAIVAGTETKLHHISLKNNEPKEPSSPEKLISDFSKNLQAKNVQKINDNEFVINHAVEIETIQDSEKNDQINLGSKTSSENIAEKSNNIISVQSSKAENKTYQSEPKNFNELKEISTQQTKSINSTLKNEAPSVNNSGNTQIKIIIQDTNQNSNQVNSNDNNVSLSKISSNIKNTLEQSPIELTAKIGLTSQTEQNNDSKNVIEQFSANNIISDRQTQNLFRSLSSNSFNVQRNLAQVITNKPEQDLEQKPDLSLSNESVETNYSSSSIEIKNTKPEKNDLNATAIKEHKINTEIKVNKTVTQDFTVQSNLENSGKTNVEKPTNITVIQNNTKNFREDIEKNNALNHRTDNSELSIKQNSSTLKESALSPESKVSRGITVDSSVRVKSNSTSEIKIEIPNNFTQDTKTSSKTINGNEPSILKNRKLNPASEVIRNSNNKTESTETETTDKLSSQKERITSENRDVNYSKNLRDSSSLNNSFRVVNDKPAKGVSGINNNSIQEEKSTSGISNIVVENSKEIKVSPKKENTLINETPKTDNKTNLYSQQEHDNSKNSNQQYNQTLSKENPSLNNQAEHSNDFRDTILGFEKKAPSFSSRTNSEVNLNSNKFDFNKFFESKSLENFVRTLNDNNLNYRAELNNLAKNNNSVELRLYPEELGRVKIIIDNADNVVSARIEVQSEQARNIILSNLPQLRESLKQEGLNTQNLNVYVSSEEHKGQNGANQKRKNNNNKMTFETEAQTEEVKIKNFGYNTIEYLV